MPYTWNGVGVLAIDLVYLSLALSLVVYSVAAVKSGKAVHVSLFSKNLSLETKLMRDIARLRTLMFYGSPCILFMVLFIDVRDSVTEDMVADPSTVNTLSKLMWFVGVTYARVLMPVLEALMLMASVHTISYAIMFTLLHDKRRQGKWNTINQTVFLTGVVVVGVFLLVMATYITYSILAIDSGLFSTEGIADLMALQTQLMRCLVLVGVRLYRRSHRHEVNRTRAYSAPSVLSWWVVLLCFSTVAFAITNFANWFSWYLSGDGGAYNTMIVAVFCYDLLFVCMMVCFMPVRKRLTLLPAPVSSRVI
ncbi:hypothetical protein KIPB_003881 [Kipferlia bialata]|uniref:Uncharacterized protein n=1 Tax=Kipferlia bialata TaxID=797122 RepID=A0A9K3CW55_9EUKA|nr:hypothetical protein KIPB_003881 [Kipferlia bialata]|eukprot:g3881.t1